MKNERTANLFTYINDIPSLGFRGTKTHGWNMAWQSAFYGPCPFQPGREKIGTAGITKAKECAELVVVNGRGEERRGDVEKRSHLHITEREMESVNRIMASLAVTVVRMAVSCSLLEQVSRGRGRRGNEKACSLSLKVLFNHVPRFFWRQD